MSQQTFASIAYNTKKKTTRRERFLAEMDKVVPWKRLQANVNPKYPKKGNGRPPLGLERMLRIYCMQQWFQLSDPAMEDATIISAPSSTKNKWRFAHKKR